MEKFRVIKFLSGDKETDFSIESIIASNNVFIELFLCETVSQTEKM